MRAKKVFESSNDVVPFEKVIEFAKFAMSEIKGTSKKIAGPSIRKRPDGSEFVDYYGGVERYYLDGQLEELLDAIQLVEDTMSNVSWEVISPRTDFDSFKIRFKSDEKRESEAAFRKMYKNQQGHWRGD